MSAKGRIGGQTVFLAALTLACVWTAGAVLDLPWLTQPWVHMWGRVAALWS